MVPYEVISPTHATMQAMRVSIAIGWQWYIPALQWLQIPHGGGGVKESQACLTSMGQHIMIVEVNPMTNPAVTNHHFWVLVMDQVQPA